MNRGFLKTVDTVANLALLQPDEHYAFAYVGDVREIYKWEPLSTGGADTVATAIPWSGTGAWVLQPLASSLFSTDLSETFISETLGAQTVVRLTSGISGFSTPVGVRTTFNRVKFYIIPGDGTSIPTRARVRIRDTNYQGAILGDATVDVSPTLGNPYLVTVDFASDITSSNPLWFEMFTDGRTGEMDVPSTAYPMASFPQARYSSDRNVITPGATTQFIPNYPAAGAAQSAQYVGFYELGNPLQTVLGDDFKTLLNTDSVLGDLFDFTYQFRTAGSSGPAAGTFFVNETVPYSGWGSPVGIQPAFSAVQFWVRAWDITAPISIVRCRIRENNASGTILADKTISIAPVIGVATLVTIDFGTTISSTGNLWVEYFTDGRTGMYQLLSVAYPVPTYPSRYFWSNRTPNSPGAGTDAVLAGGSQQNIYVAFGTVTSDVSTATPKPLLIDALSLTTPSSATPTVKIHLPDVLYAVEGIEFNIYFKNIIRSTVGLDQLQLDVVCSKGIHWERFWRYTPVLSDAGTTTFIFNIYYGGSLVATKTCSLITKAKTVGGGATRKVNWIGDSTTIDGRALAELKRIDADATLDTNLTLALQGSKTVTSNNDSTGATQGTIKCDAVTGQTVNYFYTDAASPFVFAGAFDYAQYLTANSLTMAANDWVVIALGLNDIANYTDDTNVLDKISAVQTQLDAMIGNIKTAVSGVRIAIMLTIPVGDQNTFGQTYLSGQVAWRFTRNRFLLVESFLSHYDGRQAENIYVFPYNAILDTDFNCMVNTGGFETSGPVLITQNALRPDLTFQVSFNGVHPANFGYWQMGQAAWAFLKAQES